MKVPTPPATPPVRIRWAPPAKGLMLVSSLVLWEAVKSAVQLRPRARGSITRALKLSSRPRFFILPTLVVTKFDRLVPAATGIVKIRSLVLLMYQSMVPRSEEHTSELQSQSNLVCRLLLEK